MTWDEIRQLVPHEWVLVEALDAYTDDEHGKRVISNLALIKTCGSDWHDAWNQYKQIHNTDIEREYYMLHTNRQALNIGVLDAFWRPLDRP
jgi:hypothetical protein